MQKMPGHALFGLHQTTGTMTAQETRKLLPKTVIADQEKLMRLLFAGIKENAKNGKREYIYTTHMSKILDVVPIFKQLGYEVSVIPCTIRIAW
jgi:hypothetical protein